MTHPTPSDESDLQREVRMMRLDRLVEEREAPDTTPFPIPVPELLSRYEQLYTGAVSDVLREHCLLEQALPGHLKPLRDERCVAGIAFTVKSSPNTRITGEMALRTRMLEEIPAHAFVVWDTSGDAESTAWGGVMTATAVRKGIKAAAIDGGIRDTHQILEKDFPLYYKYRSPNGSLGRCQITHYQIPVLMGRALVRPGDVVLGDIDGVVVVPRRIAMEVLLRAEDIVRNETRIFGWVAAGDSVQEITARGGYF